MEKILNGNFYNPTKGNLKIGRVIEELFNYISEKPEKFYDIIVGCDSSSGEEPHFPVAVVILRRGEGGRFFLKKISYKDRKFYNWKTRILEEVLLSCQIASYLKENFEKKVNNSNNKNPNYHRHICYSLAYRFRFFYCSRRSWSKRRFADLLSYILNSGTNCNNNCVNS